MRQAFLTAILVASLLAGCAAPGSDGPALGTAADWQKPADKAARAWAEDAVLVSASASELDDANRADLAEMVDEGREELAGQRGDVNEEDLDEEDRADFESGVKAAEDFLDLADLVARTPDPSIGDGKASMWAYTYGSESEGATFFVAVARGRVMLDTGDDEMPGFGSGGAGEALGNWSVDSDAAAAAAALDDADFARLRDAGNVAANYQLSQGARGAVWAVGIESYDEDGDLDESASLAVDAADGSILKDDEVVAEAIDVLGQEAGEERGAFAANVQARQERLFDVLDGRHQSLAFEVQMQPAPVQPVTVTLVDPLGMKTTLTLSNAQSPFAASGSAVLAAVPNGTYQVELSVPLGLYSQWRYTWCTDGTPLDDEDAYASCALVVQSGDGSTGARGETLSRWLRWAGAWP